MRWGSVVAGVLGACCGAACTLLADTRSLSSELAEVDAARPPDSAPEDALRDATPAAPCEPVSVGPRLAAKASNAPGWSDEDGARGPGGTRAHSNGSEEPLVLSDFGFAIPETATIRGIRVDISRAACDRSFDKAIALARGANVGPSRAVPDRQLPRGCFDFQDAQYGGPTDLWDEPWKPADINAPSFGVSMAFFSSDAHVDRVQVTVTYCP